MPNRRHFLTQLGKDYKSIHFVKSRSSFKTQNRENNEYRKDQNMESLKMTTADYILSVLWF